MTIKHAKMVALFSDVAFLGVAIDAKLLGPKQHSGGRKTGEGN